MHAESETRGKQRKIWCIRACALLVVCATTVGSSLAQTYKKLSNLQYNQTGAFPFSGLLQATDGNLYGAAHFGGINGGGELFKITPGGKLTILYSFCSQSLCSDGSSPDSALVEGTDGSLYGTTDSGGPDDAGTVFKITREGTLTTLHSFCSRGGSCVDGDHPYAALTPAYGKFYGTTLDGGPSLDGTVFEITPGGTLTNLYTFSGNDGAVPDGGLVLGPDGNFHGTTTEGGTYGVGTVFMITPGGVLTTLHSFTGGDGERPYAGLLLATNGNFYGTTEYGGAPGDGTVFEMTSTGILSTIYDFCSQPGCSDGEFPLDALIQANDGNFYGTTNGGGANGQGTIFRISPAGTLSTLYDFNFASGDYPDANLIEDTNGTLYGTTFNGGGATRDCPIGCGVVFALSAGLSPFVEPQPQFGRVGEGVRILGNGLKDATSVTFDGTPATFTVASPSLITTTVPGNATTGTVQVITPGGTLSSNVPFRVIQ